MQPGREVVKQMAPRRGAEEQRRGWDGGRGGGGGSGGLMIKGSINGTLCATDWGGREVKSR